MILNIEFGGVVKANMLIIIKLMQDFLASLEKSGKWHKLTEAVTNVGRRGRSVWVANICKSSRRMCGMN